MIYARPMATMRRAIIKSRVKRRNKAGLLSVCSFRNDTQANAIENPAGRLPVSMRTSNRTMFENRLQIVRLGDLSEVLKIFLVPQI